MASTINEFELEHARSGVDTLIRFHDCGALDELDRALFSLVNQTHPLVRPVIISQNFDTSQQRQVKDLVNRYDWAARGLPPLIINEPSKSGEDIRSRLLNAGIKASTGRYLSILDADDYLYSDALQWLVQGLEEGDYHIAFGDIAIKNVSMVGGVPYIYARQNGVYRGNDFVDLLVENFCPIHSFVVDRSQIDKDDLQFNESITRLEDYDFLLRVCSKYRANFTTRNKTVGVYNWKADGSNSTLTGVESLADLPQKRQPWDDARRQIAETRKQAQAQWLASRNKGEAFASSPSAFRIAARKA